MSAETKQAAGARLAHHAGAVMQLRGAAFADPGTKASAMALKAWQSARLARTYADLLASPRYRDAALFFLNDLYGPKDFSQRDADLRRILPKMTALLPAAALSTIADAVELDEISETLDLAVTRAHVAAAGAGGATPAAGITEASYASAYRSGFDRVLRERQIFLLDHIGHALDSLTRVPMLLTTLKLMRGPARMAGLSGLQQFLEQGFMHCKEMRGVDEFLGTIVRRETRVMERLIAGVPEPFAGLAETG